MIQFQSAMHGSVCDHVIDALVTGIEFEFGDGAGRALAQRYLDAEECDFVWDARIDERWLGAWASAVDADDGYPGAQLDKVAVIGRLKGIWYTAVTIVDGEGQAQGLLGRHNWASEGAARTAWAGAG